MPTDVEYLRGLDIETFDGDRHDRSSFTCSVDRIDNFFKITASKYAKDDNSRIYVSALLSGL